MKRAAPSQPIFRSSSRQFVAKALGLEIQAARFARADEVIE
jgi:hypothetical protein